MPPWLAACDAAAAEGGAANGQLDEAALCELPDAGLHLRADAARAWWSLSEAYRAELGEPMCLTDGYRDLGQQQRLRAVKPGLAAVPGTSNHGWGVAIDLCGGAESFGTREYVWLSENAADHGWVNPPWAQHGGSKPEPWHWEFVDGV